MPLNALIEPHYPKAGNGSQPMPKGRMLRICFMHQWFDLSDPALGYALYDMVSMRRFAGIELAEDASSHDLRSDFPLKTPLAGSPAERFPSDDGIEIGGRTFAVHPVHRTAARRLYRSDTTNTLAAAGTVLAEAFRSLAASARPAAARVSVKEITLRIGWH